jgi:L-seryl-tRNA(Ser) seleniumtransferase
LSADPGTLHRRAAAIAAALAAHGVDATAVASQATVGGGGAPGVVLDSAAVSLPERFAALLRSGTPPVLGRIERGRCLLDLRALPAEQDAAMRDAVLACTS